jgi:hypothetical protein
MANGSSTLARIQGRGLVETTTTAAEQTGAQLATTPAGAMEQGRGPDSAKMAGTPPAKVNALRVAMQDVGSRRLGAIRDIAKQDIEADQRVTGIRQKASVLGRLDETMATYINKQLEKEFTNRLVPAGATLKEGVYKDDKEKRDALSAAIGKIIANTTDKPVTDADIKVVNDALASVGAGAIKLTKDTSAQINAQLIASNLYDNMTPDQMSQAFGKAVTEANTNTTLDKFLATDSADTLAQAEGLADSDELTALLKSILPKGSDLSNMRLGDVTAAIQQWKQEEFKDVTTYQQTLADPTASPAQRQLALENLRRLGKVGVLALDQKVGDLDAQMQDGDTVMLGDQSFEISEFFEKPEALAQLKGWLDKPDTAPASLKGWIEANRDAIQNKVNELSPDLQDLSNKVEANLKNVAIDENWKPADQIMEEFFGDLTKPSLDNKFSTLSADDQAKFKLLQDANTGPAMSELLATLSKNSFALSGTGLKGPDIYKNLTAADLQQIAKTGVQPFIQNVIAQKRAKDFVAQPANIETAGSEVRQFLEFIGIPDTGSSFSRLASNQNLGEFQDIFNQAGLGDLVAGGQFNIQGLKDKVKQLGLTGETKPSASILDGSNLKAMREYFSTTLGKLRKATANPPQESLPSSSQARDELYYKETGNKSYQQAFNEKMGEEGRLGGINHQNMLNEKATQRAFYDARSSDEYDDVSDDRGGYPRVPDRPRKGENDDSEYIESEKDYQARLSYYEKRMDKYRRYKEIYDNWRNAQAAHKKSEAEFWNVKNDRIAFENNRYQYEKDQRDAIKTWVDNKQSGMDDRNQKVRARYTKLSDIIGGLA